MMILKKIGPEVIPALPHQAVNKGKIGGLVSQVGTLSTTPKELPKLDPRAKNVGQNFLILLTRAQQLYLIIISPALRYRNSNIMP
ncbi:MAG: hypothetical protein ISS33_03925 [Candidatus Omnitrophica bacterium]|nr:hypothetical protein [Candidatus Omnitrophota bacterium]